MFTVTHVILLQHFSSQTTPTKHTEEPDTADPKINQKKLAIYILYSFIKDKSRHGYVTKREGPPIGLFSSSWTQARYWYWWRRNIMSCEISLDGFIFFKRWAESCQVSFGGSCDNPGQRLRSLTVFGLRQHYPVKTHTTIHGSILY